MKILMTLSFAISIAAGAGPQVSYVSGSGEGASTLNSVEMRALLRAWNELAAWDFLDAAEKNPASYRLIRIIDCGESIGVHFHPKRDPSAPSALDARVFLGTEASFLFSKSDWAKLKEARGPLLPPHPWRARTIPGDYMQALHATRSELGGGLDGYSVYFRSQPKTITVHLLPPPDAPDQEIKIFDVSVEHFTVTRRAVGKDGR
jgi:hypothetical protein